MNEGQRVKEAKTIKVVTLFTVLGVLLGLFAVGLVAYWSFTGTDVLQFHKSPIPVQPLFVKSEGKITLDVDFCKLVNSNGRLVESLVSDKTTVFAPIVTESQPKQCYKYKFPIPIPPQTPLGTYHINFHITYKTNPLHTVVEDVNSQNFQVIQ